LSAALKTVSEDIQTILSSKDDQDNYHEFHPPDEQDVQAVNSSTDVAIVEMAARAGMFIS